MAVFHAKKSWQALCGPKINVNILDPTIPHNPSEIEIILNNIDLTLVCDERSPNTNEVMMHTLQKFWKNEDFTDTPLAWRDTGLKSSQDGVDSLQALRNSEK